MLGWLFWLLRLLLWILVAVGFVIALVFAASLSPRSKRCPSCAQPIEVTEIDELYNRYHCTVCGWHSSDKR